MHVMRLETAERLRSQALQIAGNGAPINPSQLVATAAGDDVAAAVAWSSFVPFLAHPVMANAARGAMALIDQSSETAKTLTRS